MGITYFLEECYLILGDSYLRLVKPIAMRELAKEYPNEYKGKPITRHMDYYHGRFPEPGVMPIMLIYLTSLEEKVTESKTGEKMGWEKDPKIPGLYSKPIDAKTQQKIDYAVLETKATRIARKYGLEAVIHRSRRDRSHAFVDFIPAFISEWKIDFPY